MIVDAEERRRFDRILANARRSGKDYITALNEAGALLTPARERRARADIILDVAEDLENASIGDLIRRTGGNPSSALDAQRAMVQLLRDKGKRYMQ